MNQSRQWGIFYECYKNKARIKNGSESSRSQGFQCILCEVRDLVSDSIFTSIKQIMLDGVNRWMSSNILLLHIALGIKNKIVRIANDHHDCPI